MPKRIFVFIVLIIGLLTGCGEDIDSPSLVYLVRNGTLIDGFQSTYCWEHSDGSVICKDTPAPYFEEIISLPSSEPIHFQLDTPLPDKVTISISEELLGEAIFSESLPPAEIIDWSPAVPAGEYIINVDTSWKQGEVTYWFNVFLE